MTDFKKGTVHEDTIGPEHPARCRMNVSNESQGTSDDESTVKDEGEGEYVHIDTDYEGF